MGILKGILFILILAAAIGFAVQNDQSVALRYYFELESHPLPLFLWAFVFFFVGLVLATLGVLFSQIGMKAKIRQLRKNLAELEKKRNELRSSRLSP